MIFAGAFWSQYTLARDSRAFEALLTSENANLAEVLEQEDVLQETKNQTPALMELYSCRSLTQDRLHQLLDFILQEPPPDASASRGYKIPFMACELLTCDAPAITNRILSDSEALKQLFHFLEEPKINLTLAGYFEKVVSLLISKSPDAMLTFIFSDPKIGENLVLHLYSQSVSEVVVRVVLTESDQFLVQRKALVQAIFDLLGGTEALSLGNTALCLCEIMQRGPTLNLWKELAPVLFNPTSVQKLFHWLGSDQVASAKAAATVLIQLIGNPYFRVAISKPADKSQDDETITGSEEEELGEFLTAIITGCEVISSTLEKGEDEQIRSSFAAGLPTLGDFKLKCIEVAVSLVRADITQLTLQLAKTGTLTVITDLFFKHHWNSFLHGLYYLLATVILNSPVLEIRSTLTLEADLPKQIANFDPQVTVSPGQSLRKGQMGHVTKIANMLIKAAETHDDIEEVLSRVEGWQTYVETRLNPILEIWNRPGPESRVQTHQTEESEELEMQMENDLKGEDQRFSIFFGGGQQPLLDPQISDDFEQGIPIGEDLEMQDLDSDMFDLGGKENNTFRTTIRQEKPIVQEEEGKNGGKEEKTQEFGASVFWKVPLEVREDLPELECEGSVESRCR